MSAANNYKIEHLNTEAVQNVVKRAKLIYSAGFFLTVSPDSMLAVGKHVAETGKFFALNLSAPFLCSVFAEPMHQVLPYADLVFGNESEAAAYAEANGFKDAPVEEVARRIAALPKASGTHQRVVCITQGATATVVATGGKVTKYPVPPVPVEKIVDSNGAGDSFVGGFLAKFVAGESMSECVRAGHWAASVVICRSGCTFPTECEFE